MGHGWEKLFLVALNLAVVVGIFHLKFPGYSVDFSWWPSAHGCYNPENKSLCHCIFKLILSSMGPVIKEIVLQLPMVPPPNVSDWGWFGLNGSLSSAWGEIHFTTLSLGQWTLHRAFHLCLGLRGWAEQWVGALPCPDLFHPTPLVCDEGEKKRWFQQFLASSNLSRSFFQPAS